MNFKYLKKKILCAAAVMVMIPGILSGCGDGSAEEETNGITIYIGGNIFEESLDPVKGAMSYGYPFTNNALLKVDTDSEYVGDLATDWEVDASATNYTFRLREGVKFHDGSDFTAEDVVFTYNQVKKNQGENENVDLSRMESVEAIDDYTVVFHLSEPYSSFIDQTACLGIVPEDSYESDTFDTYPIGTGPWKMVQYDTAQKMIVQANDEYYGGAPSIAQVTILYMESDMVISAVKSGELDLAMVEPNYTDEKAEGMHIENLETIDVRQISLPVTEEREVTDGKGNRITVGNDVTSDRAVREAMAIGIDRQKIIDDALNGVGKPAEGFTDNLVWGNAAEYEDGRKDEAKSLLEAAGWTEGSDGIYEKNGMKCEFSLYAPSGDNERFQLAAAVSEEAELLGIKINVDQKSWDELYDLAYSEGVVWGWGQYDPVVLKNLFYAGEGTDPEKPNTIGYNNAQVNSMIDSAMNAADHDTAVEAWKEVQDMTEDDHGYLYIVNIEHSYFVSDSLDISVDTQIPHPHGHGAPVINNMNEWTLEQ